MSEEINNEMDMLSVLIGLLIAVRDVFRGVPLISQVINYKGCSIRVTLKVEKRG